MAGDRFYGVDRPARPRLGLRFLGVDQAARRQWRCHHCKDVVDQDPEPVRCAGCQCRSFSLIDGSPPLEAPDHG